MRESPALVILNELAKQGATFRVYDPKAMVEAKWRLANLKDKIEYWSERIWSDRGLRMLWSLPNRMEPIPEFEFVPGQETP